MVSNAADRSTVVSTESQLPKSGERTVKPNAVHIKPCYAKPKFEPNVQMGTIKPKHSFRTTDLFIFTWFHCRVEGSTLEAQTVPSFSGWLSRTADTEEDNKSVVEYMPPLNVSINESSTVQHILETSLAASEEAGQPYAM